MTRFKLKVGVAIAAVVCVTWFFWSSGESEQRALEIRVHELHDAIYSSIWASMGPREVVKLSSSAAVSEEQDHGLLPMELAHYFFAERLTQILNHERLSPADRNWIQRCRDLSYQIAFICRSARLQGSFSPGMRQKYESLVGQRISLMDERSVPNVRYQPISPSRERDQAKFLDPYRFGLVQKPSENASPTTMPDESSNQGPVSAKP